ncbi:MAG: helix-turn-helix transcriptional regulator [Paludibacteraceae bacterium]|nr:helix-turn-helix transcriptional regulator [Paludibacteraceae bacterium]
MKTMGSRIKQKREECGLTQEELGKKLGVLRQTICKWENGEVGNIKRSCIAEMANIFRCDPVWLMGFETSKEVQLEYTAEDAETVKTIVDGHPIIGESSLRAKLYQAAAKVRPENLQAAIDVLQTLT